MLYVLDTADLKAIAHANEFYPLDGVTTNPSIIAKEKTEFWGLLQNIRNIIGDEKFLCVQTLETTAEGIVEDAKKIKEKIGGNLYIKIPIGEAGLKATPMVKELGLGVLMTAIFTPTQALIAAKAGADFVAPYVNRLDNIVGDGTAVVAEIVKQFNNFGMDCKVLAASFKNTEQVNKCASVGCHCVTVAPEILEGIISHPMTDSAIAGFEKDWKGVYGDKQITNL
jgi:fructose-6-phosphate aldolase 2